MSVLNYSTKIPAERTKGEIVSLLGAHGANRVMLVNDPDGIEFELGGGWYRIPARSDGVLELLRRQRASVKRTPEQARRVAWRTLRQWVEAQLSIVEAGMAGLDQVMLPYLLDTTGEHTMFDIWHESQKQITREES